MWLGAPIYHSSMWPDYVQFCNNLLLGVTSMAVPLVAMVAVFQIFPLICYFSWEVALIGVWGVVLWQRVWFGLEHSWE